MLAVNNEPARRRDPTRRDRRRLRPLRRHEPGATRRSSSRARATSPGDDGTLEPDPTDAIPNSYHSIFMWQDGADAPTSWSSTTSSSTTSTSSTSPTRRNPSRSPTSTWSSSPPSRAWTSSSSSRERPARSSTTTWSSRRSATADRCSSPTGTPATSSSTSTTRPTRVTSATPTSTIRTRSPGLRPAGGQRPPGASSRHDNQYVLAADEDFSPLPRAAFEITTGPNAGEYDACRVGGGARGVLPDRDAQRPDRLRRLRLRRARRRSRRALGRRCRRSSRARRRSSCSSAGPTERPDSARRRRASPARRPRTASTPAGTPCCSINHHPGDAADGAYCGSGGFRPAPIVTVCTTHEALPRLFGERRGTTCRTADGHGRRSAPSATTSRPTRRSTAGATRTCIAQHGQDRSGRRFAIEEALDERFASASATCRSTSSPPTRTRTSPTASYYAGGMRVFTLRRGGLEETGKFIDEGGNNFWGVEVSRRRRVSA